MAAEKFLLVGLKANLPADRDTNKLYWCSDTRELYKGADLYTEAVRVVASLPTAPATGVLYILPTGEVQVYTGAAWQVVAKPYVTTGTLKATNTTAEVPTAKVVFDSIAEAVAAATNGGDVVNNITSTKAGTITVAKGDNTTDVAVKGAIVNPTYDATTRTITLPYADGTDSVVIALGKDIFIDPTAENGYNAETKTIDIYLNDGSDETEATLISIPAEALIDIYTGEDTTTATVSVSDTNVITANVKVSAATGNRLVVSTTEGEEGLKVDVSDLAKQTAVDALTQELATEVEGLEGSISANQDAIGVLNGNVETEGSVDYKINVAKAAIKTTTDGLQTQIDTLNGDVSAAVTTAEAYTDEAVSWGTFN